MQEIKSKKNICRNENSLWLATSEDTNYPALSGKDNITVDAAVIGGGIAGISTALFLKQSGLKVALIEANKIAKGVSGYTSGKITSQHSLIYKYLIDKIGFDLAKQYADSNQAAVEKIADLIEKYKIECDFFRKTAYTYAETDETLQELADEVQAAKSLGLPANFTEIIPLPIPSKGALGFSNQGQFHPRKYLLKLASIIPGDGNFLFENTRAIDLKEGKQCTIYTDRGNIYAKDAVIATHFPFYDKPGQYYERMEAGMIYSFAMKLKNRFPDGVFISAEKDIYSFRSQPYGSGELVIGGGQEHVTGKVEDTMVRFVKLYDYVKQFFDIEYIEFCWSSQDNNTVDKVPYIGRYLPDSKHIYIATGFNGWGMTHGTISGMIISDLILGIKNPWLDIYDPSRFKIEKKLKSRVLVKKEELQNKNEIEIGKIENPSLYLNSLKDEEGSIMEINNKKVAVYKDIDGTGYFLNPLCPHMDCLVRWNNAEKSWDCPCHGSRFNFGGKVLNSPAFENLKTIMVFTI